MWLGRVLRWARSSWIDIAWVVFVGLNLAAVTLATGGIIGVQVIEGQQDADYLAEVPLIAPMFVIMVWHGRRRLAAMEERLAAMEQAEDARVVIGELGRLRRLASRLLLLASAGNPGFLDLESLAADSVMIDALDRWGYAPRARAAGGAGHRRGPSGLGPGAQHGRPGIDVRAGAARGADPGAGKRLMPPRCRWRGIRPHLTAEAR
jgi:hypothetical protein